MRLQLPLGAPSGARIPTDLEMALQMAELGIEPTNKVRFGRWGAEESGLVGSQFCVASLSKSELKDIAVNLNFDMVGSSNYVRFVYDDDASDTDSLASTGSGCGRGRLPRLLRIAGSSV